MNYEDKKKLFKIRHKLCLIRHEHWNSFILRNQLKEILFELDDWDLDIVNHSVNGSMLKCQVKRLSQKIKEESKSTAPPIPLRGGVE